ncbi:hypothetical protein D3C76_1241710 [compost metagenome]
MSVPTRSHSLAPVAVESVRLTLPSPATPMIGPLLLFRLLRVKSAVETAPGLPTA